uniref:Uncharacterized protein n=1 Tax=Schistosoma japonicum TaxID=6182 RepID=Q5BYQ0_SCHJA|nr:unknown [Schistosoma japonicum]
MGAAYTKVLNNLLIVDHGEATSDSNLKKAKVACVLSSTQKPTKPVSLFFSTIYSYQDRLLEIF